MKKLAAILLICALLIGVCPALAASSQAQSAADTLYDLGLFKGTGTNPDGSPVYDLDSTPTRLQALIMMLRLFGLEKNTVLGIYTAYPFGDVPEWAHSYVGYARDNGLTLGMSEYVFGTDVPVEANMYLTFVLRALKYIDSGDNADFSYDNAVAFAKTIGLTNKDYTGEFLRGDVVEISLRALDLKMKGADTKLIQYLVDYHVVAEQAAKDAGFDVVPPDADGSVATIPVGFYQKFGYYFITSLDIMTAFPSAEGILHTGYNALPTEMLYSDTYSAKEMEFIYALRPSESEATGNYSPLPDDGNPAFPLTFSAYYIIDADYNILGVWRASESVVNCHIKVTRGDDGIDGAKIYNSVKTTLDNALKNYDSAQIVISDMGYKPESDNITIRPATVDGIPLGQEHHVIAWGMYSAEEAEDVKANAYRYVRMMMFEAFFLKDGGVEYADGTKINPYFSPEFGGDRKEYAPGQWGIRFYDAYLSTMVVVFDTNGTVLGYAVYSQK